MHKKLKKYTICIKGKISIGFRNMAANARKQLKLLKWRVLWGFPGGASGKESACQCTRHRRHGFCPWIGKMPWNRNGNPLQYSCWGSPMDRGAWQATVYRAAKSRTRHDLAHIHALRSGIGKGQFRGLLFHYTSISTDKTF